MIATLVIAAAASSAVFQATPTAGTMESVFIASCLDGAANLSAQGAQPVSFDALPGSIRRQLGKPSKASVWKLGQFENAYLYTIEYSEPRMSPKVCGLASDRLPFNPAADAVATRLGASLDRGEGVTATEWWQADAGYMALAAQVREYTVLQVRWLNDAERKAALASR